MPRTYAIIIEAPEALSEGDYGYLTERVRQEAEKATGVSMAGWLAQHNRMGDAILFTFTEPMEEQESTMSENIVQEKREYVLTNADRCDKCGAQALVKAEGIGGELLFCGHHYAKNEDKMREWAFTIIDEREKINPKPFAAY